MLRKRSVSMVPFAEAGWPQNAFAAAIRGAAMDTIPFPKRVFP